MHHSLLTPARKLGATLTLALLTAAAPAQTGARTPAPTPAAQPPFGLPADLQWSFGGRVHLDHGQFDGVYSDMGSRHSATYLRRASATGAVRWHPQWRFSAALEYDAEDKLVLDLYALSWKPRRDVELRLGRVDPDFGMEQSGSGNWTYGVERSAIWDLAPGVADSGGGTGLRADGHGDGWQASLGVYDQRGNSAVVARAVVTPLDKNRNRLHLGASLFVAQGFSGDGRIRSRLGVRAVTENDAGRRSTLGRAAAAPGVYDGDTSFGVEAAWQVGRLMLQAEGLQRRLAGAGGQGDRLAQGAYVLAAWSITGEPRRYDDARGRFRSAKPADARWGAWEVFYRLDGLDVDDGRSATVHTAGIGWTAAKT
jgi:phosphate-selective porin OprO/OprP